MIEPIWERDDPGFDRPGVVEPQSGLVTLHFLRAALRRSRAIWLGLAAAGLLLGGVMTVLIPAPATGTVTLLLSHDRTIDTTLAMANDVSLLTTRTVAAAVIDELGLGTSPDEFLESVTVAPNGSSVLVVSVDGDNERDAVARAGTLAEIYLSFRRTQLESQSVALIDGYERRMATLVRQVEVLTQRYDELATSGPSGQTEAADVLTQRSQLGAEINNLRATIETTSLNTSSALDATHVLDPASSVPTSWKRRLALTMGSGLIGGLCLGIGLVLFRALTSDKVRRRVDVASALGAPVVSTSWTGKKRRLRRSRGSREQALAVAVQGILRAVGPRRSECTRVAVVSVDVIAPAGRMVEAAAHDLIRNKRRVLLIDLSPTSCLSDEVGQAEGHRPEVFRPSGIRNLARGPIPAEDQQRLAWDRADVVLTLVEADPSIGLGELASWASRAVVVVVAGQSSAERLRTVADMLRAAGVTLEFAMLLGSDGVDESLGQPESLMSEVRLREVQR